MIRTALERLPGIAITVSADGARVDAWVPAIGDGVRLAAARVERCHAIAAPNGDPAVEFVIAGEDGLRPLIVLADDVVFAPASPVAVLDARIPYSVDGAPHLVAYSEMVRDAERLARVGEEPGGTDLARLAGSFLLVRCFITGAIDCGLRPVRSVAWWEQAWTAAGGADGEVVLPPFRSDARWEELVRSAERVRLPVAAPPALDEAERGGVEAAVAALTPEDFRRAAPALEFPQLDEAFVAAWKAQVRTTPARFAATLLDGVAGARATVALYPDGGGSIEVRVEPGGDLQALLHLRFPAGAGELAVDEIRIAEPARNSGLFQRLMFRAERIGELLGVRTLTAYATDLGGYALARLWTYPYDPALRADRPDKP